ncbi:hypothetical protein AAHB33_03305 [Paenarthrobacter sp. S56]
MGVKSVSARIPKAVVPNPADVFPACNLLRRNFDAMAKATDDRAAE